MSIIMASFFYDRLKLALLTNYFDNKENECFGGDKDV
jgi:hypothetical protein